MEKLKKETYSSSGKTKTIIILITDGEFSKTIYENSEAIKHPTLRRETVTFKLQISESEKEDFEKYRDEEIQKKQQKALDEKKAKNDYEIDKINFLNSELVSGVKFKDIYDQSLEKLQDNGDYTKYSYLQIALVCLAFAEKIQIKWVGNYNSYPELVSGIIAKDDKTDIFYLIFDNKVKYEIVCENKTTHSYHYNLCFKDFNFEIKEV